MGKQGESREKENLLQRSWTHKKQKTVELNKKNGLTVVGQMPGKAFDKVTDFTLLVLIRAWAHRVQGQRNEENLTKHWARQSRG